MNTFLNHSNNATRTCQTGWHKTTRVLISNLGSSMSCRHHNVKGFFAILITFYVEKPLGIEVIMAYVGLNLRMCTLLLFISYLVEISWSAVTKNVLHSLEHS